MALHADDWRGAARAWLCVTPRAVFPRRPSHPRAPEGIPHFPALTRHGNERVAPAPQARRARGAPSPPPLASPEVTLLLAVVPVPLERRAACVLKLEGNRATEGDRRAGRGTDGTAMAGAVVRAHVAGNIGTAPRRGTAAVSSSAAAAEGVTEAGARANITTRLVASSEQAFPRGSLCEATRPAAHFGDEM